MSNYRQILYHIIFRTKESQRTLSLVHNKELFMYIHGIIKHKKCTLYRINAMEDHLHLLSDLHPGIALSDFMRDIKTSSSIWLKQNDHFPHFSGWASGYAAFTYSHRDKDIIMNYIRNQQEHHVRIDFDDELRMLLEEHGVDIDFRFFP
jgi:REP element-mobilizing transposase RayT